MADIFITPFKQSFFKLFLPPLEKTEHLMAGLEPAGIKALTMCLCGAKWGAGGAWDEHRNSSRATAAPQGEGDELLHSPTLHGHLFSGTYPTPGPAKAKLCRLFCPLGGQGHPVYWNSQEK